MGFLELFCFLLSRCSSGFRGFLQEFQKATKAVICFMCVFCPCWMIFRHCHFPRKQSQPAEHSFQFAGEVSTGFDLSQSALALAFNIGSLLHCSPVLRLSNCLAGGHPLSNLLRTMTSCTVRPSHAGKRALLLHRLSVNPYRLQ